MQGLVNLCICLIKYCINFVLANCVCEMFMSLLYNIRMLIWCVNLFIGDSLVCVKYKNHRRSNDYLHEGNESKKLLISTNLQFF